MTSKWTPEPWHTGEYHGMRCILSEHNLPVTRGDIYSMHASQDRTVACVNALAGLNPEAVGEVVATMKEIQRFWDMGHALDARTRLHDRLRTTLAAIRQEPTP